MTSTRQRRASVIVVGLAGLLLTGCGSSLGIHPGVASVVGAQSLSMGKIDDTSSLYCQAYVAQARQSQQQQSGPIPMGSFRSYVASSLSKRLLGEELSVEYDVQPAPDYQKAVSSYNEALSSTPADERDAVIQVAAADAYLQNVQVAIGEKLTGNVSESTAVLKANLARGQVATQDWLNHHQAAIDPVFGVSVDGGRYSPSREETSYPLSPLASDGASANSTQGPSDAYTSALPPAQLCQ